MLKVGNHMHKRSQDMKDLRQEGQNVSINNMHSRKQSFAPAEGDPHMSLDQFQNLNMISSSMFAKSPSMASYTPNNAGQAAFPASNGFQKRNSDQLLHDVNAVFQFLAQTAGNGTGDGCNSLKSLNQALDDQKNDLNDCMVVGNQGMYSPTTLPRNNSSQRSMPGMVKNPPICHCNHMAPHRHFYMSPSRSTKNFLASDLPHSQLMNSQEKIELVDGQQHQKLTTAHIATGTTGDDRDHPGTQGTNADPETQAPIPNQIHAIHEHDQTDRRQQLNVGGTNGIHVEVMEESTVGGITPLGHQKPPMTDRNWNNSELKKFSVTQSKSNADIADELRRFQVEGGLDSINANHDNLILAQHMGSTQIAHDTEEEEPNMATSNDNSQVMRNTGNKKGKTFTVLFKADRRHEKSNSHLRSNQHLETPGLMREASKDEYLKPGMMESGRYEEEKNKDKNKKGKSPAVIHKINILQNLNSSDTKEVGLSSHNFRLSARQQLLSVSVKNIELPEQYKVSDYQKPQQQVISEIQTPISTRKGGNLSKQQKLHEVGLQTNFGQNSNQTHQSFFNAKSNQQPMVDSNKIVVIQSQLEKYPEMMASQPTIGTESAEKLHGYGLSQIPAPKYMTNDGEVDGTGKDLNSNEPRRDGTRLLIMSEATDRSMRVVEEEELMLPRGSNLKQAIDLKNGKTSIGIQNVGNGSALNKDLRMYQKQYAEASQDVLQPAPGHDILDIFKVKGQTKNLQVRNLPGGLSPTPQNRNPNQKYQIDIGNQKVPGDEITATHGGVSQFEIPRPIYQQDQSGSMDHDYDTEGGTAYGSTKGGDPQQDRQRRQDFIKQINKGDQQNNNSAMMKAYPRTNLDLKSVADPRTDRVVRNFKPSKTKKLPELMRTIEKKMSQLADSNVTPLGLFNQDLHAQREWNKLMAQKNFSATLNDKQMSFKDAMIHEILMPLSPANEANKTGLNLPAHIAEAQNNREHDEETYTAENSATRPSQPQQSNDMGDISTVQASESRQGVYKKLYEQPRIQVFNDSHQKGNKRTGQPVPRKQQLQTKVPQARQNGKVIVFNFKGNQDLPEEILKRMEAEQQNMAMQRMPRQGSKALLLQNSRAALGGSDGLFSPKRHSSVNPNDSVSIYQKAKAALGQNQAMRLNDSRDSNAVNIGILKGSSTHELLMKEERSRYRTTVRKRIDQNRTSDQQKQHPSLSTQKFLVGRRNPTINAQMYSQKVSPFKPMGGGFKQNLNVEVTQERMEQEVAYQRDRINNSNQNVLNYPARKSRHISNNTLQLAMAEENQQQIGFSIERAIMSKKKGPQANIKDLVDVDVENLSSKTKEKIGKSALSRLDQQLVDFKANSDDDHSSCGPRGSQGVTPSPRGIDRSDMRDLIHNGSKSSTDYRAVDNIISPTAGGTHQNFAVPMMTKPIQEAIQTNDSFSKIINESPLKRKSPKLTNNQTKTTFARKKESTSVPYPMKSGIVGETLQNSSFNQSNTFQGHQHDQTRTSNLAGGRNSGNLSNGQNRNSPKLEGNLNGTRMKLTYKSNNDTQNSPFVKDAETPRKRLSPKTLATVKGATKQNPIKMDQEQKIINDKRASKIDAGVESRMRTESRGLSHANLGTNSRPDLIAKVSTFSKEGIHAHVHLIDREFSQDDILTSENSKNARQIVGLATKGIAGSDPNSSMHIVASREELERNAMTAVRESNMKMHTMDGMNDKIQNLDNNIGTPQETTQDPAMLDNPAELGNMYQMHVDAQRHIESLVSQPPLLSTQLPTKNHYIQKVAQMQMGAQNYRKKGKRQKDGLNPGFEFQNNNTADSLNRILGTGRNQSKNNRNIMTINLNTMQESKNESSGVYDSHGTDVLLNISTQNREFALSISNNAMKVTPRGRPMQ